MNVHEAIRFQALELAIKNQPLGEQADHVVRRAETYFQFLTKDKPAVAETTSPTKAA